MTYQNFGHVDPEERLDYAEDPPEDWQQPDRRPIGLAAIAVGVVVLFVGGMWFAYHEGAKHAAPSYAATGGASGTTGSAADNVPLIRADPEPVKIKPTSPGGMDVPDRDNPLYGAKSAPTEKLLPPPEVPEPRPISPPAQAQLPSPAPPAPAPAAALPPTHAAPPHAAPMTPAQIAALAKPAPPPAGDAATASATAGAVRVQLASLRSPDEARDEWTRLKRENADLLGKLTAVAVRADLGDKGIYYKIEVGPLGSKTAAVQLCDALHDRDLGCQLVR
jgi:hypothetical protein